MRGKVNEVTRVTRSEIQTTDQEASMQLPVARWSSQRVAAWAAALSLPEPQGVNMDKDDGDEEEQVQEAVMGVLQLPPGMKGRELIRCSVVRLGN